MTADREYKMCTSKKFFRFEEYARKDISRGIKKGYLQETARPYKCDFCVGWHVTNDRKTVEVVRL